MGLSIFGAHPCSKGPIVPQTGILFTQINPFVVFGSNNTNHLNLNLLFVRWADFWVLISTAAQAYNPKASVFDELGKYTGQ